ncbi:MAG: MarR family transcriptional regulator [Chloroflexota bacterium]|nr:MarR family transcriptional regulator [Chloroflexota bacterium]
MSDYDYDHDADQREALFRSLMASRAALIREGFLDALRLMGDEELSVAQLAALMLLEFEGERSVGELAALLGRSLSATSRLLDGLVRRELIDRREDPNDRRTKRAAISPRGHALLQDVHRRRADAQLALMAALMPEEQAVVMRGMDLLAEAARRRTQDARDDHEQPRGAHV